MKKTLLITICFLTLLCSCETKELNDLKTTVANKTDQTVTFVNGCTDADVWLLPDTQANRKTSLWGTATLAKIKTGESRNAPLSEPGDDGLYMLRMIDIDEFYYSADSIELHDGWRLELKEDEHHAVTLEVTNESGVLQHTYEVFSASL